SPLQLLPTPSCLDPLPCAHAIRRGLAVEWSDTSTSKIPKATSLLTSSLGLKRVNRMRFLLLRRSMEPLSRSWYKGQTLAFSANFCTDYVISLIARGRGVAARKDELRVALRAGLRGSEGIPFMPRKKGKGRARPTAGVLRLSDLPPETLLYIFSFLEPR